MVGYGLIRMERCGRKLAPKVIHDRVALDRPLTNIMRRTYIGEHAFNKRSKTKS